MDDELSELERQVEAAPADDAAWDRLMLALIARGDPLGDRIRRGAGGSESWRPWWPAAGWRSPGSVASWPPPGRANFRLIRRAPREPRFTVSLNGRVPIIEPRLPVTVLPGDRLSLPCGATARLCDDELPVRPTEGVAEVAGGVDPIEGTRAFREAMQAISSELSEGVQNFRGRGACHAKWHLKKTLLRERCDVVWRSPQDMDPHTLYD